MSMVRPFAFPALKKKFSLKSFEAFQNKTKNTGSNETKLSQNKLECLSLSNIFTLVYYLQLERR
jgi:hypothetical protein